MLDTKRIVAIGKYLHLPYDHEIYFLKTLQYYLSPFRV